MVQAEVSIGMKQLIILALVLVALTSFVYFYEIVGEEKREEARKLEERLLRLEPEEILGLEILREGIETLMIQREGEDWALKKPLETPADESSVDTLLRNLTEARRARTFENPGASLREYGLDDPAIRLAIETEDARKVLLVGKKDYTGTELYVKFENEPQVFLSSGLILSSLDKELMDWRDKSILAFDRDRLQELRIQRASEEIVLVKLEENWSLSAPIQELADSGTVSGLLSTLGTGKAQRFVAEEAGNLADYGLDQPSAVVRVREEGEDTWRKLEIGSEQEDEVFARNPERPAVFTLQKDVLKDLFQDLWEFRAKEVVSVDQDSVARITVELHGRKIIARREEFKWILEAPEDHKDKEVLAYRFWYPIEDIEFESISDNETAEFPQNAIRVLLTLKDGSERSYEFARRDEQYFARQVQTGRTGQISKDDYEKLNFEVEEITG
jgi:hypothetical protein